MESLYIAISQVQDLESYKSVKIIRVITGYFSLSKSIRTLTFWVTVNWAFWEVYGTLAVTIETISANKAFIVTRKRDNDYYVNAKWFRVVYGKVVSYCASPCRLPCMRKRSLTQASNPMRKANTNTVKNLSNVNKIKYLKLLHQHEVIRAQTCN